MSTNKKFSTLLVACAAVAIFSLPLHAASLSGFGPTLVSGSSAYSGPTLNGVIEYAVFTEAAFEANFAGFDVPAGELAYVYQILNGDSDPNNTDDPVSQNAVVGINSSVTGIGDFTIDAGESETPTQANILTPTVSAVWDFSGIGNNIPSAGRSNGLVMTSTNLPGPATTLDIVVDGGGSAIAMVVAPGDIPIPEPATIALLGVAVSLLGVRRRMR